MDRSDDKKQFADPLLAAVGGDPGRDPVPARPRMDRLAGAVIWLMVGLGLGLGLGLGAYLFWDTQQEIQRLNQDLTESELRLDQLKRTLENSGEKIRTLEEGAAKSGIRIQSQGKELGQYRDLFQGLKSEQEQQTQGLESLATNKADREDITKLQGENEGIRQETAGIREQVGQVSDGLTNLKEITGVNRAGLANSKRRLDRLDSDLDATSDRLARLSRSLEREKIEFELQEKGGFIKVLDVHLNLRDANAKKQRYDLDIYVGRKRIRKKHKYANEPVYFFVEGVEKPYEVVVTRIVRNQVAGYLTVPAA